MRKPCVVTVALLGFAITGGAQTKISGKIACDKPIVNAMEEAKDTPGHMLTFSKANCTWPTPPVIAGHKAGATTNVASGEMHGATATARGYSASVLDNGDTTVARYEGTIRLNKDGSGEFTGEWRYVRGTGRTRGIEGRGTYKGKAAADGSTSADVTGEYTLPGGRKGKTGKDQN